MKFDPWKLARLVAVPVLFMAGVLSAPYVPNWKPVPAPAPAISLEPQYKCSAGYIVRVTAATKGKTVKWRVISGPDATPSLQVVDAHTVDFASPLAGKFVLQASTSVSGESESADTEILNGSQPGPTPPDPPKPPDPPAPQPVYPSLAAAYAQETDYGKLGYALTLAGDYRQGAKMANDAGLKTLGDFWKQFSGITHSSLPAAAVPKLRAALGSVCSKELPTDPKVPLTPALRERINVLFANISADLGAFK